VFSSSEQERRGEERERRGEERRGRGETTNRRRREGEARGRRVITTTTQPAAQDHSSTLTLSSSPFTSIGSHLLYSTRLYSTYHKLRTTLYRPLRDLDLFQTTPFTSNLHTKKQEKQLFSRCSCLPLPPSPPSPPS
jgi:hypothetical protein